MSRGLGEVQLQALSGFICPWRKENKIDEDWADLHTIKRRAWGDRRKAHEFPNSDLLQVRHVGDVGKANHHSSFKRALELLVKSGYLDIGTKDVIKCPDCGHVIKQKYYYRLTDKGKCEVSKLNGEAKPEAEALPMPQTIGQVEPLLKLAPEQFNIGWHIAVQESKTGSPTKQEVRGVVHRILSVDAAD